MVRKWSKLASKGTQKVVRQEGVATSVYHNPYEPKTYASKWGECSVSTKRKYGNKLLLVGGSAHSERNTYL